MAAIKVVQEITSLDGNGVSDPIALKSGYLRITPAGGDAFVSVGTNPTATDNQSLFVAIDTPTFLKERVSSIQTSSVTNASGAIKFGLASGIEAPFAVGDIVSVTGCAPAGINTTSATVSAVTGPDPINGDQSGKFLVDHLIAYAKQQGHITFVEDISIDHIIQKENQCHW